MFDCAAMTPSCVAPVWGRGLKRGDWLSAEPAGCVAPVWGRGLKPRALGSGSPVGCVAPVWGRGLKHLCGKQLPADGCVALSWGRGLLAAIVSPSTYTPLRGQGISRNQKRQRRAKPETGGKPVSGPPKKRAPSPSLSNFRPDGIIHSCPTSPKCEENRRLFLRHIIPLGVQFAPRHVYQAQIFLLVFLPPSRSSIWKQDA